jgi:Domain of unknown function (DUF4251)
MKNIKFFLLCFTLNILVLSAIKAQESNPDKISQKVEAQNFVFVAQSANPQGGNTRQLTSGYDVTITKGSIISYLPYFGRAYTAPIDPSDIGIKFTSADFEYKTTKSKKGWEIAIKPKDAKDVQQLFLVIFDNGNARLDVVTLSRQGISFDGYIK